MNNIIDIKLLIIFMYAVVEIGNLIGRAIEKKMREKDIKSIKENA